MANVATMWSIQRRTQLSYIAKLLCAGLCVLCTPVGLLRGLVRAVLPICSRLGQRWRTCTEADRVVIQ
jgi:hypothetical protein